MNHPKFVLVLYDLALVVYISQDLEFATVVLAFIIWRHYLYGVCCKIQNNHLILQYLMSMRDLNFRQRRMIEILKYYDLTIIYHLDWENELADSLSRKARSMGSIAFFVWE